MKIAVTGASGHIGNVLIHDLLRDGHDLKVLSHRSSALLDSPQIKLVQGAVNESKAIEALLTGVDAVIHAAAIISISGSGDEDLKKVNVDGVHLMLETAKRLNIKKFVHLSSINAFRRLPQNETLNEASGLCEHTAPAYDQSKRDGQLLALSYAKKGLDVSIVNPTSVVGPADLRPSLMGKAIINLCTGKIPAIIPGGFNFVDVRDVSKGIIGALHNGRSGECYLLAGKWYAISDLAKMLSEITGVKINPPLIPEWLARIGVPFIKAAAIIKQTVPLYTLESIDALLTGNRNIDTAKARNEISFSARPFEETLSDVYSWFVENNYIKK